VLLTLAAVGVAGAVFVAGVLVGGWLSSLEDEGTVAAPGGGTSELPPAGSDGPDGSDGSDGATPAPAPTPGPGGGFDDCLVGTWEAVEHEESYDTEQGAASLTGLTRTVRFEADGSQTITYDGDEATVTTQQGALPAVFEGEVRYVAATSDGTMTFELVSSEGSVTVVGPDGREQVEDLQPGTGPVSYTCAADTFRQEATGYLSVYERVG
jgi:hypothetical protein